jgi:5-methylcytosine-specific restriction endonuclease McrA
VSCEPSSVPLTIQNAVWRRARGCCEGCGRRVLLELHRVTLARAGNDRAEDVRALCEQCHHASHVDTCGVYRDDPDDVATYWNAGRRSST